MRRLGGAATRLVLCALAGAVCVPVARADDRAAARQARDWATSCMTCHGQLPEQSGQPGQSGSAAPLIPALAGRPAADITAAMRAFRTGARPSTVMRQIAAGYSDAEVARIAAYLATDAGDAYATSRAGRPDRADRTGRAAP